MPPDRAASPANTVLVVGASGALGQSICERLADDGYDLLLTYHSKPEAVQALEQRLASRVAVSGIALDLTDEASVAAARRHVEAAGTSLHGLVFASGASIKQPWVADIGMAQWREVLAIELLGFAALAHYFIPLFRQQGGGVFVCISTFANFAYQVGDALSSVPKAGLESMVR
ncbi:MAG TPA: SDR family oxidoreductase, partial [Xanthomonadales bacterium]|nr:SDR family oxidoreductase [Xanthomonadales bacterium]